MKQIKKSQQPLVKGLATGAIPLDKKDLSLEKLERPDELPMIVIDPNNPNEALEEIKMDEFAELMDSKLTGEQIEFLSNFAKTMDVRGAAKATGKTYSQVAHWVRSNVTLAAEMQAIYKQYAIQWRLEAKMTAGKHIEIMDKLEQMLDGGEVKVAAALAKMSSDALKATGHFDGKEGGGSSEKVVVNINVGDKDTPVTIDGESVTDGD